MGLLAQTLFLLLLRVPIELSMFMSFLTAGTLFAAYRIAADWRIFDNALQKEMLSYIVELSPEAKLVLSAFGGVVLAISNFSLQFSLGEMMAVGTAATLISWSVVEVLRRVEIRYRIKIVNKEKETQEEISDRELEEKLLLPKLIVGIEEKGG